MSELKPRITENGIDYILVGDYYIPDLKLPEEHRPIGKHISMDTLARICETLNCEITDVIELVPDEPASTGGKEHERIETKNNRKRN